MPRKVFRLESHCAVTNSTFRELYVDAGENWVKRLIKYPEFSSLVAHRQPGNYKEVYDRTRKQRFK